MAKLEAMNPQDLGQSRPREDDAIRNIRLESYKSMLVTTISEHSVVLCELRKPANILDLGCRGFQFTEYFDKRGDYVLPVDIDPKLESGRPYLKMAVTDYVGVCGIKRTSDPQATSMTRIITDEPIKCVTIEWLCEEVQIPYWDLIKMDVEGSEMQIIMSLKKAPAKQFSFEGHLHTGAYGQNEFAMMEAKLSSLGYTRIYQDYSRKHGLQENYWSNLWIRK